MSAAIVDRVVVHGDNGSVLITRDRRGHCYLEARVVRHPHNHRQLDGPEKIVVLLDPESVAGDEGLIDQLKRFAAQGRAGRRRPAPETPGFRDFLIGAMGRLGFTVKQLADDLGVHEATIWNWRSGRGCPAVRQLQKVAEALDTDVSALVAMIEKDLERKDQP